MYIEGVSVDVYIHLVCGVQRTHVLGVLRAVDVVVERVLDERVGLRVQEVVVRVREHHVHHHARRACTTTTMTHQRRTYHS